jgi:hypothetical protein
MIVRPRQLRYVPWSRADDALRLGWMPWADFVSTHHGEYSPGMVAWLCSCPAPWPHPHSDTDYPPAAPVDHQTEMTP